VSTKTATLMPDVPTTWPEVLEYMRAYYEHHHSFQRKGQVYFNALHMIYPEITRELNGTDADPFHEDANLARFFAFIVPWFV
jgi:hypothetical protein